VKPKGLLIEASKRVYLAEPDSKYWERGRHLRHVPDDAIPGDVMADEYLAWNVKPDRSVTKLSRKKYMWQHMGSPSYGGVGFIRWYEVIPNVGLLVGAVARFSRSANENEILIAVASRKKPKLPGYTKPKLPKLKKATKGMLRVRLSKALYHEMDYREVESFDGDLSDPTDGKTAYVIAHNAAQVRGNMVTMDLDKHAARYMIVNAVGALGNPDDIWADQAGDSYLDPDERAEARRFLQQSTALRRKHMAAAKAMQA